MATVRFASWNVQNFSENHVNSLTINTVSNGHGIFRQLSVKERLARQLMSQNPDVVGIMEVTLGNGEAASRLLKEAMNDQSDQGNLGKDFKVFTSLRNISATAKYARRADKYSIILNGNVVNTSFHTVFSEVSQFSDRLPIWFGLTLLKSGKEIDFVLWHAPNPMRMMQHRVTEIESLKGFIEDIKEEHGIRPIVVAGDFNLDSASSNFDKITNMHLESVFAGVPSMIRTSEEVYKILVELLHEQLNGTTIHVSDIADAFLGNAYDNMFIGVATIIESYRLNLPFNLSTYRDRNLTDPFIISEDSAALVTYAATSARIISDHCPIFVTLKV